MPMPQASNDHDAFNLGAMRDVLAVRFRRATMLLTRTLSKEVAHIFHPAEVKTGMVAAVNFIGANPGLSQAELARQMYVEAPAASVLIDILGAAGLVERRQGPDRRSHALYLTPRGTAADARLREAVERVEETARAVLTEDELNSLMTALDKVEARFAKD